MAFHVCNLDLNLAISSAVREIAKELFAGSAPQLLHHYTSAAKAELIVQNRCLWATCINDQSDKTEISHTSMLVKQLAEEISCSGTPAFATDVLRRLPFFMEERKQWIYIACFCDDDTSALHWREYGPYRLSFPAPWTGKPSLTLTDIQAECWYQRVIYDEELQSYAMKRAMISIVQAVSQNTGGLNEGPWAQAMVDSCAREAAQLLLGLAVGFKRRKFEDEREWRIICAPRLGNNSSAPKWIDDNFSVNVRQSPQRHVILQIHRELALFQPLLIPSVPFLSCARNPNHYNSQELDRINNALMSNNRSDLLCL